jgi:hypothetical protein
MAKAVRAFCFTCSRHSTPYTTQTSKQVPLESGAKATALQALSRLPSASNLAERLECGAFTAAFAREMLHHDLNRLLRVHGF